MFKLGEVVQLKSGGPDMTIVAVNERGQSYNCAWMDGATPHTKNYPAEALERTSDKLGRWDAEAKSAQDDGYRYAD
jgi:uncharacterized protein YodC (DUF2158 family)